MTLDLEELVAGVRAGTLAWIARAITLVESTRPDHRELAQQLLVALAPHGHKACRIGISGPPGVGKSTFIDALGSRLTAAGHRVAVLAVDPSSTRTGGSILGDKTRMARLAADPRAFIRPSPSAGTLGGVAQAPREAVVFVEAAGFDIVIVETVGVGQSETAVADMVDSFLLLGLAGAGDQLQGIKKGVLELADVIAINKADGPNATNAGRAARELAAALRLLRDHDSGWTTPVLTCSALDGHGLDEVWAHLDAHRLGLENSGELSRRRAQQQVRWMWALARSAVVDRLLTDPDVAALAPRLERRLLDGTLTPAAGAQQILQTLWASWSSRGEAERPVLQRQE